MTKLNGEDETLDIHDEDNTETEEQDTTDSEDQDENNASDSEENNSDDSNEDEVEETPAEKKQRELAENYKRRSEKAEAELKKLRGGNNENNGNKNSASQSQKKVNVDTNVSSKDMYSMMKANVPSSEFDRVVRWAKFNKISIEDAIYSPEIQTTLKEKAAAQNTARATQTGNQRRGSARVTDQVLLENARKGIFPDNDADMERLAEARVMARKNKNKK